MAHLSISLLGSFHVTLDGEPVTGFESARVRALLAYLAVESDRPHRRETLAGLLWPNWPDRSARTNLRRALSNLRKAIQDSWPRPKMLVLNFPGNPTTQCVDLDFYEKVVAIAREHNIWVIQDLAYADIVFDGHTVPSILQVPDAEEIAVEDGFV